MTQSASARIDTLDAIRGAAVMGILIMNIVDMAMPGYAYYNPYYYCPISSPGSVMPYATSVGASVNFTVMRPAPDSLPAPTPLPGAASDGTYPYDGGPLNPVPMPSSQPAPKAQPTVPLEGRPVSLPAPEKAEKKYTYPAYGEGRTLFAQDRTVPISTPARR